MQPLYAEEPIQTSYYTEQQIAALDADKIPKHVAIILDGNRRWATKRGESHAEGHKEGADILVEIVRAAKELSITAITVYGFSTENWNRPPDEVAAVLWLIEQYAIEQRPQMIANEVRVRCIGDIQGLPDTLQKALEDTCRATAHFSAIELAMALNYGSRNEICRAINSALEDHRPITEETISSYLDTQGLPELDLLIRPGGELRISNFLLWQASYAELYFLEKMWPDFTPLDLYNAVLTYQKRQRRLGT